MTRSFGHSPAAVLMLSVLACARYCLRRTAISTEQQLRCFSAVPTRLTVATAQIRSDRDLESTVNQIKSIVAEARGHRADVLLLPEACLPGYDEERILATPHDAIESAVKSISAAAKKHQVSTIIGTPTLVGGKRFNSAVLIDSTGTIIGQQNKMQLVPPDESWSVHGSECCVFNLAGVPCGVLICHDKRYPELARLMVLGGARILFYMSCEQWHDDLPLTAPRIPVWDASRQQQEIAVYRAQLQARAVENNVWVVKSNVSVVPGDQMAGSHGHSCVIDPTGVVISKAGFEEALLVETIDMTRATAAYALKSTNVAQYAL